MLEGSHVPGMYDLLCRLFHETKTYSLDFKLLFLFKFFVLLGRFPYESKYQNCFFFKTLPISLLTLLLTTQ